MPVTTPRRAAKQHPGARIGAAQSYDAVGFLVQLARANMCTSSCTMEPDPDFNRDRPR